jgi:DivIVA domain-containing protein
VILFFVLIVVLLIGLTTAAMMGKIGGFMADPTSSQSFTGIPDGSLSADALAHVHFDQALRGYRMDQVDEVIDGLSARLRELETQAAVAPDPDVASPALSTSPDAPAGSGSPDAPAGSGPSDVPAAGEVADTDADPHGG